MEKEKRAYVHGSLVWSTVFLSLTLLIVTLIPVIGPIVVTVIPLPILYYYSYLGRSRGLAALAVAFLTASLILALMGQRANIFVLLMIVLNGLMFAEILKRPYSIEKAFVLASLVLFFSGVGVLVSHALISGVAPWRVVGMYIERVIGENLKLYEQLNISADQISLIRENAQQIIVFFTWMFPALALSGSMLTVWANVLLGRSLFRRNHLSFPDFGDLSLWKAPEKLVWLLIVSGAMTIAPVDLLYIVGLNFLILCSLVYFFQGLAIVSFFFRHKKVPAVFRGLFYGLLVVQHYTVILVIAFGLFDMWVDFRRRIAGIKNVPV